MVVPVYGVRVLCYILFLFMFMLHESVGKNPFEKNEWKKIETTPETEWSHFKSSPSLFVTFVLHVHARRQWGKGKGGKHIFAISSASFCFISLEECLCLLVSH